MDETAVEDRWQPRRAYRDLDAAMVGGVAAGLARHLRLPAWWVRAGFVAAAFLSGFGVVVYAGLWLVLRERPHFDDDSPGLAAADRSGLRPRQQRRMADRGRTAAIAAVGLGVFVAITILTGHQLTIWPIAMAVLGVAVLWHQADEAQRERWLDAGRVSPLRVLLGEGGWAAYARVAAGVLLLLAAIGTFALRSGNWRTAGNVAAAGLLGIVGLAFVAGPWLIRLAGDLSEERAERVRSQERADVAAHLHDSVLQTLALIQRSADDPTAVTRLARAQERDLRSWLYDAAPAAAGTLAATVRSAAASVEDATGVPVGAVVVGDRELDDDLAALVAAVREAALNAGRHSGAAQVDVYVEVADHHVEAFVRDRGKGFVPEEVPADRHGVRDSIIERLRRHGGSAEVQSDIGAGTEVRLRLPLPDHREEADD